jgi:type IX secretion system PorP/SprF family membrane protein
MNIWNRIWFSLFLLGGIIPSSLFAQQIPIYSQYYFNSFIYNPAQTGIKQEISASLFGRRQFTKITPVMTTNAFTFQARLKDQKSGFGLYAYQDQINLFESTAINGTYAYHIPFTRERVLSFGLGISALQNRFNSNQFYLVDADDQVFTTLSSQDKISMDGSMGVNMDFGKFSLGLASLQLLENQGVYINNATKNYVYTLAQHWMFSMRYDIDLGNNVALEPFMLFRKTHGVPGQTDWNLLLNWQEKWYASIAYRDGLSFSSMLGLKMSNRVTLAYSYDITTHHTKNQLGNTHEVLLKYQFNKSRDKIVAADTMVIIDKGVIEKKDTVSKVKQTKTTIEEDTAVKDEKTIAPIIEDQPKEITADSIAKKDSPILDKEIEPVVPKKEVLSSKNYYVIAGSFISQSSANSYAESLNKKGISAFIKYAPETARHYVHVGEFKTKEDALNRIEHNDEKLALWIKIM